MAASKDSMDQAEALEPPETIVMSSDCSNSISDDARECLDSVLVQLTIREESEQVSMHPICEVGAKINMYNSHDGGDFEDSEEITSDSGAKKFDDQKHSVKLGHYVLCKEVLEVEHKTAEVQLDSVVMKPDEKVLEKMEVQGEAVITDDLNTEGDTAVESLVSENSESTPVVSLVKSPQVMNLAPETSESCNEILINRAESSSFREGFQSESIENKSKLELEMSKSKEHAHLSETLLPKMESCVETCVGKGDELIENGNSDVSSSHSVSDNSSNRIVNLIESGFTNGNDAGDCKKLEAAENTSVVATDLKPVEKVCITTLPIVDKGDIISELKAAEKVGMPALIVEEKTDITPELKCVEKLDTAILNVVEKTNIISELKGADDAPAVTLNNKVTVPNTPVVIAPSTTAIIAQSIPAVGAPIIPAVDAPATLIVAPLIPEVVAPNILEVVVSNNSEVVASNTSEVLASDTLAIAASDVQGVELGSTNDTVLKHCAKITESPHVLPKADSDSQPLNKSLLNLPPNKVNKVKYKARKTGQPFLSNSLPNGNSSSGSGTIKIMNLHPKANITLSLSELEEVLKVKDLKTVRGSTSFTNSMNSKKNEIDEGEVKTQIGTKLASLPVLQSSSSSTATDFVLQLDAADESCPKVGIPLRKKRRKNKNTYDFPGKKASKKRKNMAKSTDEESVCSKDDDRMSSFEPLRKVLKKPISSPRKQHTVLDLLTRNSHKAFRKRRNVLMHRKSHDSPRKGRTVMDMLRERQRLNRETASSSLQSTNSSEMPKLTISKDGMLELARRETNEDHKILLAQQKRKISGEGAEVPVLTPDGVPGKKRKTDEENSQPPVLQPVVMVVTQHLPFSSGLRSLLPKPSPKSAAGVSNSGPATMLVTAGQQILLSAQPLLVQTLPPGAKAGISLLTNVPAVSSSSVANTAQVPSVATVLNFRPNISQNVSKNTDALRALLTKNSGQPCSLVPGSVTTAKTIFVSSSMSVTSSSVVPAVAKTQTLHVVNSSAAKTKLISSSSVSSSSLSESVVADTKVPNTLPNGLSLPVTPPKTPEGEVNADVSSISCASDDVIPLCHCKIGGATFTKLSSGATYCQALDSVDGKVLGCCNKVTNLQLVRPGVKIPFMAVCEVHRKRLRLHQCCPGCGHFCTQGKFLQCKQEGGRSIHNFHKQCQTIRDSRLFCPHCGEESGQVEVTLTLHEPRPDHSSDQTISSLRKAFNKAKMASSSSKSKPSVESQPGVTITLPNAKTICTDGLPVGLDRSGLERLFKLFLAKEERPKKYRVLPKSMYQPASEGDLEKVFFMLIDGMDPNQRSDENSGQTPMHGAVCSGNLSLVYLLLQAGAAIHVPDKTLKTPLMCAAELGHLAILKLLADAGARLDDRGEDRMTCLHYGAKAGHLHIIQYILDVEAVDINATDEGGWTPIMWATESQLVNVVRYLVSRGGDPNMKDNEENTGLHWAAFAGSIEITELFMDLGCELDSPNEHGDRPLHIAARQDHYEVVVVLLARGANVELKNNKNESPIECCLDPNGQVSMALKVNKQLRSFASKLSRPERLLHRDISLGREKNPIACVNALDDEPSPTDYLYVDHNVETQDLHINNVITSLQSCRCKDDCSSVFCVCARSSVKCWYDKYGRLLEEFSLLDPPHIFECNRACRCWVNCNNRVVQNGITCRLQMFKTSGRGWGVRSLMDIPKGTFICEYIGELISDSEADRREDDSYLFDLDNKDGDTYCIDARKYGNVARFINHLCEPNLVPVKVFMDHQDLRFPRICFFSSREIKSYEELGFDYGEKFWIIKWKQFTCTCGSPKCKYSSETIKRTLEEYRLRHEDDETVQEA